MTIIIQSFIILIIHPHHQGLEARLGQDFRTCVSHVYNSDEKLLFGLSVCFRHPGS